MQRAAQTQPIIVVGAGPAGMMAAIRAASLGCQVILLEKNAHAGAKLLLSGKGRCNLTNQSDAESFLGRFSGNGQFLRDAFKKFFTTELIHFFQSRGLRLKTERQLRVFPVSDRAGSVLEVLTAELRERNVTVLYKTAVRDLVVREQAVTGVSFDDGTRIPGRSVILATGGVSYPLTGSTGDGIRWAARYGHRLIPLRPGLVALETRQDDTRALQGLALKNVRLRFASGNTDMISEIGELLFTDFGVSGPLVLTASGAIADWLLEGQKVWLEIDIKPALSEEKLDQRLLRELQVHSRKGIAAVLKELLPASMVAVFLARTGIPKDKKANQITAGERQAIIRLLKAFRLDITATRPISEAMVTRGGVSLKDINPRTMESRIIKGLYFAGEMIDIDADTGGFNLQAAFSTGYLAGESAASSRYSK